MCLRRGSERINQGGDMRKPIDNGSGAGRKEECGHREDLRQRDDVRGRAGGGIVLQRLDRARS